MANEIYNTTWWGNAIDTARTAGTNPDFFGSQMKMLTSEQDELVTNGDFANGTTSWTSPDYNSTLSIVNKQLKIVSTISLARAVQAITTKIGSKYIISATITNIDSSTGIQVKLSNGANLDGAYFNSEFNTTTNPVIITHSFVATATTTYIGTSQGTSVGQSALLNKISVQLVRADNVEAVKCLADWIHRTALQDLKN